MKNLKGLLDYFLIGQSCAALSLFMLYFFITCLGFASNDNLEIVEGIASCLCTLVVCFSSIMILERHKIAVVLYYASSTLLLFINKLGVSYASHGLIFSLLEGLLDYYFTFIIVFTILYIRDLIINRNKKI